MKKNKLTKELYNHEAVNEFYEYLNVLPNPDKILRRTGNGIEVYRDLKNDAHLWSCIQSRKSGTLSLNWKINGTDNQANEMLNQIFEDLDIYQIIRDILEAPLFGYQPMEIVWNYNSTLGYLQPQRIIAKPQEWFSFDTKGRIKFNTGMKEEEVPKYKLLDVRYESTYMNPYGNALLSKCYWSVKFKNGGLRQWVKFTEKYGMPIIVGKYGRGASHDEIETLADELVNMAEDAVLVTPADVNLEMHEAGKSTSAELYRDLIKYCNAEISKAILSQTLTTELDMGSYAAAQTHYKVRQEVIQSDMRLVERTFNTLIRYIFELNGKSVTDVRFEFEPETEPLAQK